MTLTEAENYARRKMKRYLSPEWQFAWEDGGKKFIGCCDYGIRTVSLDPKIVSDSIRVMGVVLHEIAHALTPHEKKTHGPLWQKTLVRLIAENVWG